jgi:predicted nucleic acid-binding protein
MEAESVSLRAYLDSASLLTTNRVAVVEVARAARRRLGSTPEMPLPQMARFVVLKIDAASAERAGAIGPPELRALDAIHLASALELGSDLAAFVSYDGRLSAAASALGLPVVSPGAT